MHMNESDEMYSDGILQVQILFYFITVDLYL